MSIIQGEDGYLKFIIPTDNNNPNITLPRFNEYINWLNDSELALSLINRLGLITSSDVHGVFLESMPNSFKIIFGQEFNPLIYRGQNVDYPFMCASQRYELFDGEERIRHSIDWIKKNEFKKLISITPYYTRAKSFKVLNYNYEPNLESIAMSYNFVTDYIDITRNIMVAYFFAYTYYDREKGALQPIEDFETYTPILYVGNLKDLYSAYPKSLENTSFQLMLRAKAQVSMSIDVSENRDSIKGMFKKIELPKNPMIAKNVFNQFEGGNVLFPPDYASKCAIQVRQHMTLQKEFIEQYCTETGTDIIWLLEEYRKLGYEVINQFWDIPEQAKYIINREIDEYILPYLNTNFIFRSVQRKD